MRSPSVTTRTVKHQAIEENFVRVLQGTQIDVALEVVVFSLERLIRAQHVFIKRFNLWG
jgi:hypothetical protein